MSTSDNDAAKQWARRRRRRGWALVVGAFGVAVVTIVAAGFLPRAVHGFLALATTAVAACLIFGLVLVLRADPLFAPYRLRHDEVQKDRGDK